MFLLLFGVLPTVIGLSWFYWSWARVFGRRSALIGVGGIMAFLLAPAAYQYVVLKTMDFKEFEGNNLSYFMENHQAIRMPGHYAICGIRCREWLKESGVIFVEHDSLELNKDILLSFQKNSNFVIDEMQQYIIAANSDNFSENCRIIDACDYTAFQDREIIIFPYKISIASLIIKKETIYVWPGIEIEVTSILSNDSKYYLKFRCIYYRISGYMGWMYSLNDPFIGGNFRIVGKTCGERDVNLLKIARGEY